MQGRLAVNLCYSSDPLQASALGLSAWVGVGCRGGRCPISLLEGKMCFFLAIFFSGVSVKERFLTLERCPKKPQKPCLNFDFFFLVIVFCGLTDPMGCKSPLVSSPFVGEICF